ncbi:uncharacterized protein CEXT_58711 [Caerostris extrusa]|uniref:Uncharacterized protein n=1 Tax=Caerostris extrusa TaxID=172846 RepID=A0AAV4V2S6_CAEEX|nr:uncharacterized protein CEXT_58711 [Caerostris extrusa]
MSKVEEPSTKDSDVEYSETLELSTLGPEIVLKPPWQFAETHLDISTEGASTSKDYCPAESRPGQTSTFKRFSPVEDVEVIQYENVMHGFPNPESFASTEHIVPRNPYGQDSEISDDLLSLRTRLKIKKRRLGFLPYACFAMEAVMEEGIISNRSYTLV